uniref:Uncharacterized protein n=1 Tax=Oryza punctata TaxID=4537 RepID=A0A0E0JHW4_ORYPU
MNLWCNGECIGLIFLRQQQPGRMWLSSPRFFHHSTHEDMGLKGEALVFKVGSSGPCNALMVGMEEYRFATEVMKIQWLRFVATGYREGCCRIVDVTTLSSCGEADSTQASTPN